MTAASGLRVLFVGGTGLISSACARAAVAAGHELTVLNRGRTALVPLPPSVRVLRADVRDEAAVANAVSGERFDVVVQWVGFRPSHIAQDLRVFADAGHYVFISSATVYEKPPLHYLVTEHTPRGNPYWAYAREKIACEDVLTRAHEAGFPMTIVRPSHTYGPSQIPVALASWDKPWTVIDRMRRGRPILVPGDGTGWWTLTHNSDFAAGLVPLLGLAEAIGLAVQITSDEVLTWDQIHRTVAAAAGVEVELLHVPTDAIVAADPGAEQGLRGDKMHSVVFDNSLLRRLVPGFAATTPFATGVRDSISWFEADPARRQIDRDLDARWDALAAVYGRAPAPARRAAAICPAETLGGGPPDSG